MIRFDEYRALDATAMAELVSAGELSAQELVGCAYQRYCEINPVLNAATTSTFANAYRYLTKNAPAGKFAGVPIFLKDLLAHFAGVPTSGGSNAWRYVMQTMSSTLVQRLCAEGAIVVGKSNTPEFGLLATTENKAFGKTRNPWNLEKTTGGSSGGSAALVAAGVIPMASAGDGGGSIRIPASCCGLFGLKPTRGLVPNGGEFSQAWDGATAEHVITRSVRDSARALDVIAGPDAVSHTPYQYVESHFESSLKKSPKKLRIAFTLESPLGGVSAPECQRAILDTVQVLQDLGHTIEESKPSLVASDIIRAYSDIYIAHVTAEVARIEQCYGKQYAFQSVEPLTYMISRIGRRFSAGSYVNSREIWVKLRKAMVNFHQLYDMWLTPVLLEAPYNLGDLMSSHIEQRVTEIINVLGINRLVPVEMLYGLSAKQLRKVPFTQIANLTGQPAMSVPLSWSPGGLPIGVQFIGRVNEDARLLQLAHQLEQAKPWFTRVPALSV